MSLISLLALQGRSGSALAANSSCEAPVERHVLGAAWLGRVGCEQAGIPCEVFPREWLEMVDLLSDVTDLPRTSFETPSRGDISSKISPEEISSER